MKIEVNQIIILSLLFGAMLTVPLTVCVIQLFMMCLGAASLAKPHLQAKFIIH